MKEILKIGNSTFDVNEVKSMTEKEFIKAHKDVKGMPKNISLSEIYKKISGKEVTK